MKSTRYVCALLAMVLLPALALAQGTGGLTGTVTDQSGAVVPNATIQLADTTRGTTISQTTGTAGTFTFTGLKPGVYNITVTAKGFKVTSMPNVNVQVGTSGTLNARLQVGQVNETVEVTSSSAELQTTDAAVGNVLSGRSLASLPSLSRDATALLQLQPMATPSYNQAPGKGSGDVSSGSVAGAMADQHTFTLDGGDITNNTEGDGNYIFGNGTPHGVVATPVESLEEFKVTTNNSNTFTRSAGAQVQLVTRRGSNSFHGALYEYNQNEMYNANTWELNHQNKERGIWRDNRYGGRIGGPILKNRAFFFLMYEGHKFKKAEALTATVPTETLKQGIMRFRDAAGSIISYNFAQGAPTAMCANGPCDPRGLGMSPITQQFFKFMPVGNDATVGDGLNTIGYVSQIPVLTNEHQGIARFDYKLNDNWDILASGRYNVVDAVGSAQYDIGGFTGGKVGVPVATSREPVQPRFYVLGLTGRISPYVTNDLRVNYLRNFWSWNRLPAVPQVSGLQQALQLYAESRTGSWAPYNINTQNARSRVWDGIDYNINDELTWLKGNHLLTIGGSFRRQHFIHFRDDKVVGGLTNPINFAVKGSYQTIVDYRPPTCGTTVTTNCLKSTDQARWDSAYVALMGMVDHSTVMRVRDSDLKPLPVGSFLKNDTSVLWYDLHFVDTWRVRPTLTLSYGLDWGLQTPPYEYNGLETIMVYQNTNQPVIFKNYLEQLKAAAEKGQTFAPTLGFAPIKSLKRKYPYDMDMHNFAPRISLAWSPAFDESGFLGKIFGNQKSSIRMGYGRYFDRANGVGLVMTPALGIGFGNAVSCKGPNTTGACQSGRRTPADGFRIGVDGMGLTPASLVTITGNVVPGTNSPYETYDFRIDPKKKTGVEDTWNFSIQRQLSNSLLFEVGYVGRVAHHLYGAGDTNQVPYMMVQGGQSFATAFDFVQKYLYEGGNRATIPAQPFFETALAGQCAGFTSCTQALVAPSDPFGVVDYITHRDVTDFWDTFGFTPLNMDSQFLATQITISNRQSKYHSMYATIRKQMTRGLMFQGNYTWSHSIDDGGINQQYIFISSTDQYKPQRDYQSSNFDRRHIFSGFVVYDLPFGAKQRFKTSGWVDKLIGGWSISTAIAANTGAPLQVDGDYEDWGSGYTQNWSPMVGLTNKKYKVSTHSYAAGSAQCGATSTIGCVTGFADRTAVQKGFRRPYFADGRMGGSRITGLNRWNTDMSLHKTTQITERVSFGLSLQAVNVFNHMEFNDPSVGFDSSTFGRLTTQYNSPRFLSIGARIDF